jgi:ribosomal protein S27AE
VILGTTNTAAADEENMTELDTILSRGVCALCGMGVHIDDHEGRVACNGCNMATDNCDCQSKSD